MNDSVNDRVNDSVNDSVTHRGGCHCGAVRFELQGPADLEALECNCSRCAQIGFLHLIVPRSRLSLLRGEDALTVYTFHTGVARHMFCSRCGVQSFYVPRSNPDGYSVNARCLEPDTIRSLKVTPFDGQHWERSAAALRHLSRG